MGEGAWLDVIDVAWLIKSVRFILDLSSNVEKEYSKYGRSSSKT
jgi:hypothetical protein